MKSNKRSVPVSESPRIISMGMTSRCNLKCVMCDHGIRNVEKEEFADDLVERIAPFIPKASLVDLTGLGEPLLSNLFWQILAKYPVDETEPDSQYMLTFNSNGTLLNENNTNRILASRVKKVRISIDAADSNLYRKIRGTSLEKVIAGLRNLVLKRNSLNRNFPKIGVEMTVMRENIHNVHAMIDLCKEIGLDFLEVWSLNELPQNMLDSWTVKKGDWEFIYSQQLLDTLPPAELKEIVDNIHDYARQQEIPLFSHLIQGEAVKSESFTKLNQWKADNSDFPWKEESIRCILPWTELRATYQGDIYACCWGPQPLGNLRNETIEEIWNNEAIHEMRSDLIEGKIPRLCSGAGCPHIRGKRRVSPLEWTTDINNSLEIVANLDNYKDVIGFFPLEQYKGRPLRWTNGNAQIPIVIANRVPPKSLTIKAWNLLGSETPVHITANDVSIFNASLPLNGLDTTLPLPPLAEQNKLVIKINSEVFQIEGDTRELGIAIESLLLSEY